MWGIREGRWCDVADVSDCVTKTTKRLFKTSSAVGVRPHNTTSADFTTIKGGALKYAMLRCHEVILLPVSFLYSVYVGYE
jgi:hypothetical protein